MKRKIIPLWQDIPGATILFLVIICLSYSNTLSAPAAESITIRNVAARYDFPQPRQTGSNIFFAGKHTTMTFETESRKLLFNNLLIWLNEPVTRNGQDFGISKYDADAIIDPLMRMGQRRAITNSLTVLIDPGHGGKDTGAIGPHKACEKKITLDIAAAVKRRLESPRIAVKMTRKWDSAVTRPDRINEARKCKADIFVSIHINSAANSEAAGIETYIIPGPGFQSTAGNSSDRKPVPANKFDNANIQLAYCVHRQTLAATGAVDRGIRHARFDVIMEAPCPAILIECGFVSNPAEEARLSKKQYRETIAEGIAKGIQTLIAPAPQPLVSPPAKAATSKILSPSRTTTPAATPGKNAAALSSAG